MFTLARERLLKLGAPRSLWEASATAASISTSPLRGAARADVAVVGGGIAGLSTALHLAQSGAAVTLLEAESIGFGASGRNGGQVIPGFKRDPEELISAFGREAAESMIDFAGRTADFTFDLIARQQILCNAVRHGWIQAAHDEAALSLVRSRVRQWSERGAPVASLDAAELAALSGTVGYCGGWIDRRAGRLHPLDYTRGLARAAQARGATLHERSAVRELAPAALGWRLTTAEGTLQAEKVVLCMNAYATDTRAWSALRRAYIPVSTCQLASEPLDQEARALILKNDLAISDTHPLVHYFRLDAEGRLIMGGRGALRALRQAAQVMPLLQSVERLFPQLHERYRPQFYWGGSVALTLDHLPHLHDLRSGVYAFYGCNGRGVALASAIGASLARLACGASASEVPLRFTPLRTVPLHAAHPLYIQAATLYYMLQERFKRPPRASVALAQNDTRAALQRSPPPRRG